MNELNGQELVLLRALHSRLASALTEGCFVIVSLLLWSYRKRHHEGVSTLPHPPKQSLTRTHGAPLFQLEMRWDKTRLRQPTDEWNRDTRGCVYCCCYCYFLVTKLCLTLCNPIDCSPPGSSVHGILQARILEWVAMLSSRGSSRLRNRTHISCIGRRILYR